MSSEKPTVRWGIVATGLISSWFVSDLVIDRPNAQANHVIQAVGSSSLEKGKTFVATHIPGTSPSVYGSYEEVYADPQVDVVYIGTPHSFHKQNCLDAIRHGKSVLCEKAFTLNAADAKEVLAAAKEKGVFVMEAMWTRFFPLARTLQKVLHEEKAIGKVLRTTCDFSKFHDFDALGPDSRLKNPALGAGTLLDIGIYSLTWCLLGSEPPLGSAASEVPKLLATQVLQDGIDVASTMVLRYADGRQGIATSHAGVGIRTEPTFCRIEGSEGVVTVEGIAPSVPNSFTVRTVAGQEKKYEFERPGKGFYWEADAVALAIAAGKKESDIMPWRETIRVLELMDEVRRQGGARFPQDP